MVDFVLATLFLLAGGVAAFLIPGRPNRLVVLLAGAIAGFSVSASLVILQRLVFARFFEVDFVPAVKDPLELFVLAGINGVAFIWGFFGGQVAERFLAPWRANARRPLPPAGGAPPREPSP